MTKEQKLKLIWRHTHKDFRGVIGGCGAILILSKGATCLVPMTHLTDAEINDKLRSALMLEVSRLQKMLVSL